MAASKAAELNERGVELAKERKLNEAAELFRQAASEDPQMALAHRNLGHALLELGKADEAIACYEQTLKIDSRSVESLNNLGMLRSQKKDYAGAIQVLSRAVKLAPDYAPAFNNLGIALAAAQRHAEAVDVFRRALELRPQNAEAINNLGLALVESNWPDQAIEYLQRAIQLNPGYADAHRNLGIAYTDVGRLDEALAEYDRAIELDPAAESAVRANRAKVLLLKGDFSAGWREYESRLDKEENVRVRHDGPRWDGSSLQGRTLLLEAEQGLGDTIQFVRLGREIKRRHEGRIVLAVEPKLLALLAGVEGVDLLVPQDQPRPSFDVWSPLLSVPGLLNLDPKEFVDAPGYLKADPANVERWKREFSSMTGVKVGITWQGNPWNKGDKGRSFALASLAPLAQLHGVSLISLQKGAGTEQLDELTHFDVLRLPDEIDRGAALFDTAAIIENLDLVISADTSLAHLAGALGKPVWVPLNYVPDWRWGLKGDQTPWYRSMRLFRQTTLRDWEGVFQRIRDALLEQFPKLRPRQPAEFALAASGPNRLAYTRHGPIVYNRHDTLVGKSLAELGEYAQSEVDVFRQCVRPGTTAVDAGAHIGAHTLALARLVGPRGVVHAFEPQRVLLQALAANAALSSLTQVHCHWAAVGEAAGTILVPTFDFNKPNNFGALELGQYEGGERVPVVTIDSLRLAACGFIKMDVAGMELRALQGARETLTKYRPILYIANERQEKSPALIEALLALGYKLYWHVSRYYQLENYYRNGNNAFGQLSALNMLGIHSSVATDIQGLPAIKDAQSDWRNP